MKRLLISHIADEDGITPVILAKIVYGEIDTLLLNPKDADEAFLNNVDKYDSIHVVDLNVSPMLAQKIDENPLWKSRVKIFDHHKSALGLNKYDFITVIDDGDNQKESGTSIYYNYLLSISDNAILRKNSTKGLVFAENYRSQVGNTLLEMHPEIDFMIIINVSRSISYRAKGKVDLTVITSKYNGGGHKNAGGSPLSSDLREKITKMIFPDIIFEKEKG